MITPITAPTTMPVRTTASVTSRIVGDSDRLRDQGVDVGEGQHGADDAQDQIGDEGTEPGAHRERAARAAVGAPKPVGAAGAGRVAGVLRRRGGRGVPALRRVAGPAVLAPVPALT